MDIDEPHAPTRRTVLCRCTTSWDRETRPEAPCRTDNCPNIISVQHKPSDTEFGGVDSQGEHQTAKEKIGIVLTRRTAHVPPRLDPP